VTRAALLAAAVLLAGGVGGSSATTRSPELTHIVVVVLENKAPSDVDGRAAPTLTRLGRRYARLTNYYAVAHPSLPNYLALISGSTHGVRDDCTDCAFSGPTIGDTLTAAGRTWAAYAEGYPSSPRFAKRHVPFLYFAGNVSRVRPLAAFRVSALPDFAFVVPDLCHDMHDCSVRTGDRWLTRFLPELLDVPRTAVFVVFDEDDGSASNRVPAFVLGTAVRPHAVATARLSHYSLLRTIEDNWHLPRIGRSAPASPIPAAIWR
jgi:acid phosphatase